MPETTIADYNMRVERKTKTENWKTETWHGFNRTYNLRMGICGTLRHCGDCCNLRNLIGLAMDKVGRAMVVFSYVVLVVLAFWAIVVGTMIFQIWMEWYEGCQCHEGPVLRGLRRVSPSARGAHRVRAACVRVAILRRNGVARNCSPRTVRRSTWCQVCVCCRLVEDHKSQRPIVCGTCAR